jgi:hypothetical protein
LDGAGLAPLRQPLREIGPATHLVFLGPRRFVAKTPAYKGWIILDFLGFSRPNRDFSMGYTDFSEENFSSRFFPNLRIAELELAVEAMRKRWVAHEASLS